MNLLKLKKAAMFGLDARIALAIFGALSVISGGSVIQCNSKAKVTSIITDMNEIGKAWEAYYLDTGVHLAQLNTTPTHVDSAIFNAEGLVKSLSVAGWSGPYVSYEFDGASGLLTQGQKLLELMLHVLPQVLIGLQGQMAYAQQVGHVLFGLD